MKTFGRLILETRKAARLTQKAVASVFGAETVAKFYPLRK
jgi:transcriptional regulator with XRE-family HTH domain